MVIIVVTCGPYFLLHPDDAGRFFFTNVRIPGRLDLAKLGINFRFADVESAGNIAVQGLIAKSTMQNTWGKGFEIDPVYNFVSWVIFTGIAIFATIRAREDRFVECLCLWVTMYFMVYTNVWEFHYLMLLPVATFLYMKYRSIWPLLAYILMAIPIRHLGYAHLLPNWDMPFLRPISAVILFGYCIYLMVRQHRP